MGFIRIHHEQQFHNEMAKIPSNRLAVLTFERPNWGGLKTIESLSVRHPETAFIFIPTDIPSLISEYSVVVNDEVLPYFVFVKGGADIFCVKSPDTELIERNIRKFDPTYKEKSEPARDIPPEPYFDERKIMKAKKKLPMRKDMPENYISSISGTGSPDVGFVGDSKSAAAASTSQHWKERYDKTCVDKSQDLQKQMQASAVASAATATSAATAASANAKAANVSCESVGDKAAGSSSVACRVKVKLPDNKWRIYEVDPKDPISMIREMMLVDCPHLAGTRFRLWTFVTPPFRVLDESVSVEDAGCLNARIQARSFR